MRKRTRHKQRMLSDFDAPMVEVFGGALALLIIVFILVNLIVTQDIRAMLDRSTEDAQFKVSWQDGGEGFIVITYPDRLRIIETNQNVAKADICKPNSPFMNYITRLYNNTKEQLIFAILDGGVDTMALARNCMLKTWPRRPISIGWIIANKDLLSTVRLEDLPARVKRSIQPQ